MLEWLVPIGLFWIVGAVYLGGARIEFQGTSSGPLQVAGLLVTLAIFLLVWWGLRSVLGGFGGMFGRVIFPTLLVMVAFPWIARGAFRTVGVIIRPADAAH